MKSLIIILVTKLCTYTYPSINKAKMIYFNQVLITSSSFIVFESKSWKYIRTYTKEKSSYFQIYIPLLLFQHMLLQVWLLISQYRTVFKFSNFHLVWLDTLYAYILSALNKYLLQFWPTWRRPNRWSLFSCMVSIRITKISYNDMAKTRIRRYIGPGGLLLNEIARFE